MPSLTAHALENALNMSAHVVEVPVAWCPPKSNVHPREAWSQPIVAWTSEDPNTMHTGLTLNDALNTIIAKKPSMGILINIRDPRALQPALKLIDVEARFHNLKGPIFIKAELLSAQGINADDTYALEELQEDVSESDIFKANIPLFRRLGFKATHYTHGRGYAGETRKVETNVTAFVAAVAATTPYAALMPFLSLDLANACMAYFHNRRGGVWNNYATPSPPPPPPNAPPDFQAYLRNETQKLQFEQRAEEREREEQARVVRLANAQIKGSFLGSSNSVNAEAAHQERAVQQAREERHSKNIIKGEWLGTSNSVAADETASKEALEAAGYVLRPVPDAKAPFDSSKKIEGSTGDTVGRKDNLKEIKDELRAREAYEAYAKMEEADADADVQRQVDTLRQKQAQEAKARTEDMEAKETGSRRSLLRKHNKRKVVAPKDPKHEAASNKFIRQTMRAKGYERYPALLESHTRAVDELLWGAGWRGATIWPVPACLLVPSWSYAEEKLNRTVYVEGGGFSDMGEDVQDHSLFVYGDIMEKEAAFLRSHIPPERVYLNLTTEFMAMNGKYADVRLSVPDA